MRKRRLRMRWVAFAAFLTMEIAAALPVCAQGISGGGFSGTMNLQTGVTTLVSGLLLVFGALILGVAGWKGIEATMDHRSVMPALVGLVMGLALCFGGGWIMTQLGTTAGTLGTL
jgi:hypothetical protein